MTADLDTLSPADRLKIRASDYDRVVAALDFLSEHWREQPDLAAAAKAAGLSPHHFQRVFTRWYSHEIRSNGVRQKYTIVTIIICRTKLFCIVTPTYTIRISILILILCT